MVILRSMWYYVKLVETVSILKNTFLEIYENSHGSMKKEKKEKNKYNIRIIFTLNVNSIKYISLKIYIFYSFYVTKRKRERW